MRLVVSLIRSPTVPSGCFFGMLLHAVVLLAMTAPVVGNDEDNRRRG